MLQNTTRNRGIVYFELPSSFQFSFSFNFKIVPACHKRYSRKERTDKTEIIYIRSHTSGKVEFSSPQYIHAFIQGIKKHGRKESFRNV